MESKDNSVNFIEDYYENLNNLQKEDKFYESINLVKDLGIKLLLSYFYLFI